MASCYFYPSSDDDSEQLDQIRLKLATRSTHSVLNDDNCSDDIEGLSNGGCESDAASSISTYEAETVNNPKKPGTTLDKEKDDGSIISIKPCKTPCLPETKIGLEEQKAVISSTDEKDNFPRMKSNLPDEGISSQKSQNSFNSCISTSYLANEELNISTGERLLVAGGDIIGKMNYDTKKEAQDDFEIFHKDLLSIGSLSPSGEDEKENDSLAHLFFEGSDSKLFLPPNSSSTSSQPVDVTDQQTPSSTLTISNQTIYPSQSNKNTMPSVAVKACDSIKEKKNLQVFKQGNAVVSGAIDVSSISNPYQSNMRKNGQGLVVDKAEKRRLPRAEAIHLGSAQVRRPHSTCSSILSKAIGADIAVPLTPNHGHKTGCELIKVASSIVESTIEIGAEAEKRDKETRRSAANKPLQNDKKNFEFYSRYQNDTILHNVLSPRSCRMRTQTFKNLIDQEASFDTLHFCERKNETAVSQGRPLKQPAGIKGNDVPKKLELEVSHGIGCNANRFASNMKVTDDAGGQCHEKQAFNRVTNLIESNAEVQPSLYAPLSSDVGSDPIIHKFNSSNRPLHTRKMLQVSQIYENPVGNLWKTAFQSFNYLQSEIANKVAYSDDNVVVSAPTGAGKTVVFEMAMGRFFSEDRRSNCCQHNRKGIISKSRKMVYVSPSKALCEERFKDWSTRLIAMDIGIEVAVVTGDGDPSESFRDIASAHLILTTPEKWDSITRRWTENFILFATVKLFMIDEVHLIADENRGWCLESIICRLKTIQRASTNIKLTSANILTSSYTDTDPDAISQTLRMVAVSATLPNIADIAEFLEANEAYSFDESYRPVPLTTHVIGQGKLSDKTSSHFHFWRNLDRSVPEIIRRYCNNRPSIVFCHSKAETEKLADLLATAYNIGRRENSNFEVAGKATLSKLQRVLTYGIGYHHAGLESDDRKLVEKSFRDGKVRVLCATSTLAMGVNLPAHLVVIKGTKAWRGVASGYQDLEQSTLLQMIGRAGRPRFDTSGTAVILTDNDSKALYEKLAERGLHPALSQIAHKLVESINSEISQRVITSIDSAINWVKTTLFYIQLKNDPAAYGVQVISIHSIDTYILQMCARAIDSLQSIGAVAKIAGQELIPQPASHIMSQHLVDIHAMTLISNIPFDACQAHLLKELVRVQGLHSPVRRSEKKFLNEAHKQLKVHRLDGPLSKVRVQEPWEKAFVLLQVYIDQLELEKTFSIKQEMVSMAEYASRMLTAIEEYSIHGSKYGNIIVQSLKLRRALALRLWNCQDGILQQVRGISRPLAFTLSMGGLKNFDDVLQRDEREIERIAGRLPPFGAELRRAALAVSQERLQIRAAFDMNDQSIIQLQCHIEKRPLIGITNPAIEWLRSQSQDLHYTLVAYTDTLESYLIYQPKVTSPGVYEAHVPSSFKKVTVCLISSMAGLDEKEEIFKNEKTCQASQITAQKSNTLQTYRRVRNANQTRGGSTGAPRSQVVNDWDLFAVAKDVKKAHQDENEIVDFSKVTPSPKPCGSSWKENKMSYGCEPPGSSMSHGEPSHEGNVLITLAPERCSEMLSSSQPSPSVHTFTNRLTNSSTATEQSTLQPVNSEHCKNPVRNEFNNYYSQKRQLNEEDTGDNFSRAIASWRKAKRQHITSQRRAFVHRKDNPFSDYKHDPNDAESYLDVLSSSQNSPVDCIIPENGMRALANAYRDAGTRAVKDSSAFRRPTQQKTNNGHGSNQKYNSNGRLSNQQLLAIKAAEQNAYQVRRKPSPTAWNAPYMHFADDQQMYHTTPPQMSQRQCPHQWSENQNKLNFTTCHDSVQPYICYTPQGSHSSYNRNRFECFYHTDSQQANIHALDRRLSVAANGFRENVTPVAYYDSDHGVRENLTPPNAYCERDGFHGPQSLTSNNYDAVHQANYLTNRFFPRRNNWESQPQHCSFQEDLQTVEDVFF